MATSRRHLHLPSAVPFCMTPFQLTGPLPIQLRESGCPRARISDVCLDAQGLLSEVADDRERRVIRDARDSRDSREGRDARKREETVRSCRCQRSV